MSAAKKSTAILGPGKVPITVSINGNRYSANLEPCITLLDAMRECWNLTGAKRVCDRATCGACTVLLNEKRLYACSLLAIDVQEDQITTIESLSLNGTLDPIQKAFVDSDAMQCGFCTAGFIMSCKAFLSEVPNPSSEELLKGMSGNLCRCGSYLGIKEAITAAAEATHNGPRKLLRVARRRRQRGPR
jgi:xanthine dehydrogenase YagT iron-sulfur-binding subunit